MKSQNPKCPLANTNHPRFNGVQVEIRPGSFVIYDADRPAANGVEFLFNQLDGLRAALNLVESSIYNEHPTEVQFSDLPVSLMKLDAELTGIELRVLKARSPEPRS